MDWQSAAVRLAREVTRPDSPWYRPLATTPRHLLVPRWWTPDGTSDWVWQDGRSHPSGWLRAAYTDQSLVTQVGTLHADHAAAADRPRGLPTSSGTLPGLVVQMLDHAEIVDDIDVLEVGTGSGYGAAVLTARLGDTHVTSIDVDSYLTQAATERLDGMGHHPRLVTADATDTLPGRYDRIVATVAVTPIPASWLSALRPGGRLVTTLTATSLIITADATADGGATGRVVWDRAGFMPTRTGGQPPPDLAERLHEVRDREGEEVTQGRYPVLDVEQAWDIASMLQLTTPGIRHHYQCSPDGHRTAWMVHPDGSWTRASAPTDRAVPIVHQGGPRRLMDALDRIRLRQLVTGDLPARGARVRIDPDGTCHLRRGRWQTTIPPASNPAPGPC